MEVNVKTIHQLPCFVGHPVLGQGFRVMIGDSNRQTGVTYKPDGDLT